VLTPFRFGVGDFSFSGLIRGVCGVVLLGKNRDRLCIVAAILEAANSGATKTHIMVGAHLSFSLLEKYLGVVVGAGFVRVEGSRYVLTLQGQEFLRQYGRFQEHYVGAQKLLEALDCDGRSWF
jgi:predicted transcriptional regulator